MKYKMNYKIEEKHGAGAILNVFFKRKRFPNELRKGDTVIIDDVDIRQNSEITKIEHKLHRGYTEVHVQGKLENAFSLADLIVKANSKLSKRYDSDNYNEFIKSSWRTDIQKAYLETKRKTMDLYPFLDLKNGKPLVQIRKTEYKRIEPDLDRALYGFLSNQNK